MTVTKVFFESLYLALAQPRHLELPSDWPVTPIKKSQLVKLECSHNQMQNLLLPRTNPI